MDEYSPLLQGGGEIQAGAPLYGSIDGVGTFNGVIGKDDLAGDIVATGTFNGFISVGGTYGQITGAATFVAYLDLVLPPSAGYARSYPNIAARGYPQLNARQFPL